MWLWQCSVFAWGSCTDVQRDMRDPVSSALVAIYTTTNLLLARINYWGLTH